MRKFAAFWGIVICLALAIGPVSGGWLDAIVRAGGKSAKSTAAHSLGALEAAAAHLKLLPHRVDRGVIAASGSHEGHWRFVNRSGEAMTSASADEIARALNVLAPEMGKSGKLAVYLTEDTVYQFRAMLKDLPQTAEMHVIVGKDVFPLVRQGEGIGQKVFADVRPNLAVEIAERARFEEALWQLGRPLNKSNIRVIALEPGSPNSLSTVPRLDRVTKRAETDIVDPDRLRVTLAAIRNQTALITGRVEGELLYFRPARGAERSLPLRELTAAAEVNDVNLIILRSSSPRQPGARNWLWQQVEVAHLDDAISRATMSDFLDALAQNGRMTVVASPTGSLRTTLELVQARAAGGGGSTAQVTSTFNEILSEVTGKVLLHGVSAVMRSSERQRELDARLVPGIPSELQHIFIGNLILGLLGLGTARAWWQRIWPPEVAVEYGNSFGYRSAWLVRGVAFFLLFLPLVGLAAFLVQASRSFWGMVTTPVRWLARRIRAA